MKLKHLMALLFVFWAFALEAKLPEKEMVFIVPSYKNVHWHHANLHSLLSQEYDNYRIIYIDDHSPDNTGAVVESYLIDNMIPYQLIEFDESEDYRESIFYRKLLRFQSGRFLHPLSGNLALFQPLVLFRYLGCLLFLDNCPAHVC